MSDAKADVLKRVRSALGGGASVPEVPREYRGAGSPAPSGGDVVELFCERCADYRATVRRVSAAELPAAVAAACAERGARRLVTPPGGPSGLEGLELVADDPPLGARALDGFDGVLSGCALAIAETGTIVLDGGARSGRRAITLVPDYHVCVVEAERIVAAIPDAVAALGEAAAEGRPITFVSGPSATSDIELDRVEGVHGPRTLDVFVVHP
ncbi:MAG: LUD domain-containing protein [Solirubrobacteraceae bacterium]